MKARWALAVAVACELLVAAVGLGVVRRPPPPAPRQSSAPMPTVVEPTTTTTAAPPTPLELEIAALSDKVASLRGLSFLRPVRVRPVTAEQMQAIVLEAERPDAVTQAIGLTLGYFDPARDPALPTPRATWAALRVRVFYDIATEELLANVEGDGQNPASLRTPLVTALTLALDDQHFDLDRVLTPSGIDETDLTLATLAGGDSLRITEQYVEQLSDLDREEIAASDRAAERDALTQPPLTWRAEFGAADSADGWPNIVGPLWIERLLQSGGQAALDAEFRSPPPTTAELLRAPSDPLRFVQVATPPADGEVIAEGAMGLAAFNEFQAAQWTSFQWNHYQWVGGRWIAWQSGPVASVRFTIHARDGLSAALLRTSLELTSDLHGHATLAGPRVPHQTTDGVYPPVANAPVTYTACGPPDTRDQAASGRIYAAFLERFHESTRPRR
ncbi:MAG: hypothetical protein Q8K63_13225 [Acidimicrobiales bacterium]|nr:hypothetical protein [Acidimicrobiales bacterium]